MVELKVLDSRTTLWMLKDIRGWSDIDLRKCKRVSTYLKILRVLTLSFKNKLDTHPHCAWRGSAIIALSHHHSNEGVVFDLPLLPYAVKYGRRDAH